MKAKTKGLLWVTGTAALAAGVALERIRQSNRPPKPPTLSTEFRDPIEELGVKDARVVVEAYLPADRNCQEETLRVLRDLVKKHPKEMRLVVHDFFTPAGMEAGKRRGIHCATVLVNGRQEFVVATKTRGGKREVTFVGRPGDETANYTVADLVPVVEAEIRDRYGHRQNLR